MDGLALIKENDSTLEQVKIDGKPYYLHPVKQMSREPLPFNRQKVHFLETGAFVLRPVKTTGGQ